MRQDNASDEEPYAPERVDEPQCIVLIRDAQISSALAALDIVGRDDYDYLRVVFHLEQHLHFAVRLETGENARGVIVVEELSSEFQEQLSAEMVYSVSDMLGLELDVFVIVKAYACHLPHHLLQQDILYCILWICFKFNPFTPSK